MARPMRNEHPGTCYRCGLPVAVGDGHFEMVSKNQKRRLGDVIGGAKWLTQHASCAIEFRGTDVHFKLALEELDENRQRLLGPRKVPCPYCENVCEAVTGAQFYLARPDLAKIRLYVCVPCDARVGCHDGTWTAKGSPAKGDLRRARMEAHAAFDPLALAKQRRDGCSKNEAPRAAYLWLSDRLGIVPTKCHIGMMDMRDCRRVIELCQLVGRRQAA